MNTVKYLQDRIIHLIANNAGNGQMTHIFLDANKINRLLLEKYIANNKDINNDDLEKFGKIIGWNYGRFPSEIIREKIFSQYGLKV